MDYETWLLEQLLMKYEKSRAFTSGVFSKRIAVDVKKERVLQESMERTDEKDCFLSVLEALRADGMVDFSWVKYEDGNLVDKIWLVPEEPAIRNCYRRLKLIPKKDRARELGELISRYLQEAGQDGAVCRFLREMLDDLSVSQRIPRFFTEDAKLNEDVLRCMIHMEKNHDELMERLMSSRLYEDSKYFERNVKAKVLSILRYIKKKENEDIPDDDELLREMGIVRWPEIMEFTGKAAVVLEDGDVIDYSTQKYGAYINSDTVKNVGEVLLEGIQKIIFIENKANYIWYVSHEKAEDELAVYHGGCYSPVKGMWFTKLYEGSKKAGGQVGYVHWSDIDVGGFHIFSRLKRHIIPELEPYRMDGETLEAYRGRGMEIQSVAYRAALQKMEQDDDFKEFWGVIHRMLDWGIRLEQEQIIV